MSTSSVIINISLCAYVFACSVHVLVLTKVLDLEEHTEIT